MKSFQPVAPISRTPGFFSCDDTLLRRVLRTQVDFYFSPERLEIDHYLQCQLNEPNHFGAVSIDVICNFPKIRELHAFGKIGPLPAVIAPPADPELLRLALEGSSVVSVSHDGLWILPKIKPTSNVSPIVDELELLSPSVYSSLDAAGSGKDMTGTPDTVSTRSSATPSSSPCSSHSHISTTPLRSSRTIKERTTVIARDVPKEATAEQVLAAFATEQVNPKTARLDLGNTWFVEFATEEQAVEALSSAPNRTIAGARVRGGIKSELAHLDSMCCSSAAARSFLVSSQHVAPFQEIQLMIPSLSHPENFHPWDAIQQPRHDPDFSGHPPSPSRLSANGSVRSTYDGMIPQSHMLIPPHHCSQNPYMGVPITPWNVCPVPPDHEVQNTAQEMRSNKNRWRRQHLFTNKTTATAGMDNIIDENCSATEDISVAASAVTTISMLTHATDPIDCAAATTHHAHNYRPPSVYVSESSCESNSRLTRNQKRSMRRQRMQQIRIIEASPISILPRNSFPPLVVAGDEKELQEKSPKAINTSPAAYAQALVK
jgi:hypothetical protein